MRHAPSFCVPVALLASLFACSCEDRPSTPDPDLVPPFVRGMEPGGNAVPVGASFAITFSEPLRPDRILPLSDAGDPLSHTVVLGLATNRDALVAALDSPPISDAQRAKTIPAVVALSDDHTVVTVTPVQPLEKLTAYVVVLSKTIMDASNNKLVDDLTNHRNETQVLEFQTESGPVCHDEAAPRLDPATLVLTPGATTVTVTWRTDEPGVGTLELFSGPADGLVAACAAAAPECVRAEAAAATCTAEVDPCHLADPVQYVCERTVTVASLKPETTYAWRLVTKDAAGNTGATDPATFTTLEKPRFVLSELLVSTRGIPGNDHDLGKFVELVNVGNQPADLVGWKLVRCKDATCAGDWVSTWTFEAAGEGANTKVAAGAYALATGKDFDRVLMGVPEGTTIVRGSSATLSLLLSSTATAYALLSPEGEVASTYGAHLPAPGAGATVRSFERLEPAGPDVATNWAPSQLPVAGAPGTSASPGQENGLGGSGTPRCVDQQAPQVDQSSISVSPAPTSAVVTWNTDEGGKSLVQVFKGDAAGLEAACDGGATTCVAVAVPEATCTPAADSCALPEPPIYGCRRTATIAGLTMATAYSYRLITSDASGNDVSGEIRGFTTTTPPKLALNEILAITRGLDDHDFGKFVEIYNGSDFDVELTGWKLARCSDATCTAAFTSTWTLGVRPDGISRVTAHGYAVAAGTQFDAAKMGVPAGVPVLKGSTSTLSIVTASTAYSYALVSPEGLVVSTYGAWLGTVSSGADTVASWERKGPLAADETTNWAGSTAPIAGAAGTFATPGLRNTVTTLPPDCTDQSAPIVKPGSLVATAAVSGATISWLTDERGPGAVQCAKGDATALETCATDGTCLNVAAPAAACSAWVDSCALPDPALWQCTRSVALTGLLPETAYTCRVRTEDPSGNVAAITTLGFTTQPMPKVALTEVLVTTRGIDGRDHDRGKFVEIQNAGTTDVDLAGWRLVRCANRDCTGAPTTSWTLRARAEEGSKTVVAGGAFAVVGGTKFDATLMGVPTGVTVVRGSTDTLSFVTSSTANTYGLVAPTGELVSKYGGWLPMPGTTSATVKSFERRQPLDADGIDNWLASSAAVTGAAGTFATPGAHNTATDAPPVCHDEAAPRVDPATLGVVTNPRAAVVTWHTDEAGPSVLQIFKGDAAGLETACAASDVTCVTITGSAAECTATLDACTVLDPPQYPCTRTIAVSGLEPETTYAWRVTSKDLGGHAVTGAVATFTTPALPIVKLVLNEVFASPKLATGVSAEEARFFEIFNAGPTDVDLTGWVLARCAAGDNACANAPDYQWALKARADVGATAVVKAGAYAVVGGDTFSRTRMAVPEGVTVVRGATSTILGGKLLKSESRAYALLTPEHALHSTYGAHSGVPSSTTNDGRSFERIDAAAQDVPTNWGLATNDLSGPSGGANFATPGAKNTRSP